MNLRKVRVEADPKKPYKMYAAIAAAVIGSLLTNEIINSNPLIVAIGSAVLAGLAVFTVRNPTVVKDD